MNDYVEQALKTESTCFHASVEDQAGVDYNSQRLIHAAMGLSSEVGEIADAVKASIFYGKTLDAVNVIEEMGDVLWYMAILCDEMGVDIDQVMKINIDKLKARYGDKFSSDKAINRDLTTERNILEDK